MPKLSIAFNAFTVNDIVEDMTIRCLKSFRPFVDEIVFSEDGGMDSKDIRDLSDTYLWHDNFGSCRCTNIGWEAATGDFVINAQTDTEYVNGNLRDLCIEDKITNPRVIDSNGNLVFGLNNDQHSEFFCVSRSMKEKYGMLDERFRNYMQDFLYFNAIVEDHLPIDSVVIKHYGHGTINQLNKDFGWDEKFWLNRDNVIYLAIVRDGGY